MIHQLHDLLLHGRAILLLNHGVITNHGGLCGGNHQHLHKQQYKGTENTGNAF